jgi:hypothetical protein
VLVTIFTAALAAASAILIRDAPAGHPFHARNLENLTAAWRGVREVLAVRELWPLLAIASTAYAVTSCMLGLWGGPYLFDIHGLDTIVRGGVIFWLPAGMIVGNFAIAPLDRVLGTRKRIVVGGALGTAVILLLMAFQPGMPLIAVAIAFALIGILSGYTTVIIAHGRCFYPDRLMGRGVTVVNTAVLAGAGILQALTGLIAGVLAPGATSLSADVYRIIFATLAAVLLAALLVYRRCPDVPTEHGAEQARSTSNVTES